MSFSQMSLLLVFNRVLWDDHLLVVGQQSRFRIRGPKLQSTKVSTIKAALSIMLTQRCIDFDLPLSLMYRFELGAALFVGWGGALLLIAGGIVLGFFSGREGLKSR